MRVITAGESAVRIEVKGWKKGHGRSATANTRTAKSIAVLCSQPCGTVVTVMWSTFLGLVDIYARQATLSRASRTLPPPWSARWSSPWQP